MQFTSREHIKKLKTITLCNDFQKLFKRLEKNIQGIYTLQEISSLLSVLAAKLQLSGKIFVDRPQSYSATHSKKLYIYVSGFISINQNKTHSKATFQKNSMIFIYKIHHCNYLTSTVNVRVGLVKSTDRKCRHSPAVFFFRSEISINDHVIKGSNSTRHFTC